MVDKFIKIPKPKEKRKIPSDLLTPKDIEFLAGHALNLREKAIILILYESETRIDNKDKLHVIKKVE